MQPTASRRESPVVAPTEQEEQEQEEEIPVEELEAKLLSVKRALERFDDVKVWYLVLVGVSLGCQVTGGLFIMVAFYSGLKHAYIVVWLDNRCSVFALSKLYR